MAVLGEAAFRARMRNVMPTVREEVRKQMEKEAEKVANRMRYLVPRKRHILAKSIGWSWGEAPEGSVAIGAVGEGALKITIHAGDASTMVKGRSISFQNAKLQEFGTVRMPANPFFYPAWRQLRSGVKGNIRRAVKRGWKKA